MASKSSECSLVHVQPLAVPVVSMPKSAAAVTCLALAPSSVNVSHSPIRAASLAINSNGITRLSTRAGLGSLPSRKGDDVAFHGAQ